MVIPIAIAGSIGLIYVTAVLMWPIVVKPALRRRYERQHHRSKIERANRPSAPLRNDSGDSSSA